MDFGLFPVWTITNKAPMNTGLQVCIDICFYFSWKKYLRAEWLGHMVSDALHSLLMICSFFIVLLLFCVCLIG